MKTKIFIVMILLAGAGSYAQPSVTFTPFASGFNRPIGIENCGDSRLFIVEQRGDIKIVDSLGTTLPTSFLDIQSIVYNIGNEQGLLGLAFSPDYANNGYFYVNYIDNNQNTVISRFSRDSTDANKADPNSELVLLNIYQPYSNHNGGNLKFGPDGYLYDGQGDGGLGGDPGNRAQNLDTLLGKILRIDVDHPAGGKNYGIPPNNPFVGIAGRDEIWDYGVRNPWRWSFDRITGDLWIGEVGQDTWEEVDFEPAHSPGGINYGWRCWEANHPYNSSGCGAQSNYTFPIFEYPHGTECSITGGFIYRGAKFGGMFGYYFTTDYCSGKLWSIHSDGNGSWINDSLGLSGVSEPTSFGEDHIGELYLASQTGTIYHIEETSDCNPAAMIYGGEIFDADTLNICQGGEIYTPQNSSLDYQWQLNGANINGAIQSHYAPLQNGFYSVVVTVPGGPCSASDSVYVVIHPIPTVSFTGLNATYNVSDAADTLTGIPGGGTFSGTGMIGNVFYPDSAGIGTYTISYSYMDQYGCSNSSSQDVTVGALGIENIFNASINRIAVYPNPSSGMVNLFFDADQNVPVKVSVSNALGDIMLVTPVMIQKGEHTAQIDLSSQPSGFYLLNISGQNVSINKKVSVVHH